MIVLHSKSKAVASGKRMWHGSSNGRDEYVMRSVLNRRRISAEAARLRKYIDTVLDQDESASPMLHCPPRQCDPTPLLTCTGN